MKRPTGPASRAACAAVALGIAGAASAQDTPGVGATTTISTWDGQRFETENLELAAAAIVFRTPSGERTLAWHRVRDVQGADAAEAADLLAFGRTVWRATTRLGRGDSFGAEPLFEAAFERTRGSVGPTPAVVADGLLRCRLRRGARAAAIDAWLELAANLAVAPARNPQWGLRSPAVDTKTRLVPSLPPIWYPGPAARAFADEPLAAGADADDRASAVRVLYRAAARHAVGDPIDATETSRAAETASTREGGSLVTLVVLAQIGGPEARASARAALAREQQGGVDRWRSVWASIAIGRSLLREPDETDRRRGVLQLLAVHAIDAEVSPYLTGVALADAAIASRDMGDTVAERVILGDLRREYPDHPVWALPGLDPSASPGESL